MSALATTFGTILNGLKAVIAELAAKDRPRTQFLVQIWTRLNTTIQRFEKLVTHWRNNTLPRQRKRAPRPGRPSTTPSLPAGKRWILNHVDHVNARAHASQLQHFLTSEACVAFLAEVPRAGRILRPLARSLGLQMPGDPPPPPPKPAPTPKPAKNVWLTLPQPLPSIGITVHGRDPYPLNFSKAR
jgi:hypothetical protein